MTKNLTCKANTRNNDLNFVVNDKQGQRTTDKDNISADWSNLKLTTTGSGNKIK